MKGKKNKKYLYILYGVLLAAVVGITAYSNGQFLQGDLRNIDINNFVKKPSVSCSGDFVKNSKGYKTDENQDDFEGPLVWHASMSDGSTNVNYAWSGDAINGQNGADITVTYPYEYVGGKTVKAHVKATLANGEIREADCSHVGVFAFYQTSALANGMTMDVSCKAEVYPLKPDDGSKIIVWTTKINKLIVPGYQGAPGLNFTQSVQGSDAKYEWHGKGLENHSQNSFVTTYSPYDNTKIKGLVKISVSNLVPWAGSNYFNTAECEYDLSQLKSPTINIVVKRPLTDGVKPVK